MAYSLHIHDIGSFLFVGTSTALTQGQSPAIVAGMPVGPGITPQPAFIYRGVWLPVCVIFTPGSTKSHL